IAQYGESHRLLEKFVDEKLLEGLVAMDGSLVERRHHDDSDRARLRIRLQLPAKLAAIEARHQGVGEHELGDDHARDLRRGAGAVELDGGEAEAAERGGGLHEDARIVVDDQRDGPLHRVAIERLQLPLGSDGLLAPPFPEHARRAPPELVARAERLIARAASAAGTAERAIGCETRAEVRVREVERNAA